MHAASSIPPRPRRRRASLGALLLGPLWLAPATASADGPAAAPAVPAPAMPSEAGSKPTSTEVRVVVVEWRIRKGRESEFLESLATRSTVPDRADLIAEFLSGEESRERFPWINWAASEGGDYTTFYNIDFGRSASDCMGQIGKYIDNNRPPLPFEADRRHRVFLEPLRWRIGQAGLPGRDAGGVR